MVTRRIIITISLYSNTLMIDIEGPSTDDLNLKNPEVFATGLCFDSSDFLLLASAAAGLNVVLSRCLSYSLSKLLQCNNSFVDAFVVRLTKEHVALKRVFDKTIIQQTSYSAI